jgi:hypothetical protein
VTASKGFMVYAHPCRGLPEPTVNDLDAALEVALRRVDITSVDAVEGHNGRNTDIYNRPALELAARYKLKSTGGSDAHRTGQIGTCVTVFERDVTTDAGLLDELRAGRFTGERFRARETWSWQEDTRTIERRWI